MDCDQGSHCPKNPPKKKEVQVMVSLLHLVNTSYVNDPKQPIGS